MKQRKPGRSKGSKRHPEPLFFGRTSDCICALSASPLLYRTVAPLAYVLRYSDLASLTAVLDKLSVYPLGYEGPGRRRARSDEQIEDCRRRRRNGESMEKIAESLMTDDEKLPESFKSKHPGWYERETKAAKSKATDRLRKQLKRHRPEPAPAPVNWLLDDPALTCLLGSLPESLKSSLADERDTLLRKLSQPPSTSAPTVPDNT